MDWLSENRAIIKYSIMALIAVVAGFQAWLVNRKAAKTQETIRVFELVEGYRKLYERENVSDEDGVSEIRFMEALRKSEEAYRIQMGGHLQQYFSFRQMSAAIKQRKENVIFDGEDILPGMMMTAKNKALENIKQIKASLKKGGPDGQVSTRRRRRR